MKWKVTYYNEVVANSIGKLPKKVVGKYLRLVIEEFGPNLGMPHTKAMKDGLFELRIISGEQSARAFYCTLVNREIVILHTIVKKTQKTPKQALEVARNRLKEIKNEQ